MITIIDNTEHFHICPERLFRWRMLTCALALWVAVLLLCGVPVAAQTGNGPGGGGADPLLARGGTPIQPNVPVGPTERENCPLISPDGNVMYFNSTRKGIRGWARFDSAGRRFDDDIYYMKRTYNGWSQPVNLGQPVNSDADDGVAAMSPDGQIIYFVSFRQSWRFDGGPFYEARRSGTSLTWTDIQGLGGGLNTFFRERDRTKGFRIYGASISPDTKDFYFATTVNSQRDEHELWVSHKNEQGQWSAPHNLGPAVNAPGGSYSPYIAPDNRTLYFASRRAGGYGGDDIYMTSRGDDGIWSEPHNLGQLINTPQDEAFPSLAASGNWLYVSSTNKGRETVSTTPMPLPAEARPAPTLLVSGTITDKTTGTPVEAIVTVEDLKTGKAILTTVSYRRNGVYSVVLQPGRDYGVSISAPHYFFVSDRYTLPPSDSSDIIIHDFQMNRMADGQQFDLNNIFFEYNQAVISPESFPELNRLVSLFRTYPGLRILINGHADSLGADMYNMDLSVARAQAVKKYLMTTGGIDSARVEVRGYGANRPAATNESEEGRRINRRTEILVMEM